MHAHTHTHVHNAHTCIHAYAHDAHTYTRARSCTHTNLCLQTHTACSGHRQNLGSVSCLSLHWLPSVSDLYLNLKDKQTDASYSFLP